MAITTNRHSLSASYVHVVNKCKKCAVSLSKSPLYEEWEGGGVWRTGGIASDAYSPHKNLKTKFYFKTNGNNSVTVIVQKEIVAG